MSRMSDANRISEAFWPCSSSQKWCDQFCGLSCTPSSETMVETMIFLMGNLFLRGLLRRCVEKAGDAALVRGGTHQLQPGLVTRLAEDRHAFADRGRVDEEVVLIDQVVADQLRDEGAAAVGHEVAFAFLEALDGRREVTVLNPSIVPFRLCEGARGDELCG